MNVPYRAHRIITHSDIDQSCRIARDLMEARNVSLALTGAPNVNTMMTALAQFIASTIEGLPAHCQDRFQTDLPDLVALIQMKVADVRQDEEEAAMAAKLAKKEEQK